MIDRNIKPKIDKEFDVIVIGGGINGTGIARDISERGLKVLLLEKNDFSSGCTGMSTRLIHGGLRYLEHLEFDLVRESLVEREYLLKNASHLVRPLKFCLPVYKHDKRKFWLVRIGMLLYEMLNKEKSLPRYKTLGKKEVISCEPSIKSDDLVGGVVYYDSQIQFPERLCIENILMAESSGAVIINHAEVTSFKLQGSTVISVEFTDRLSSNIYSVKAKQVINASGPWVDKLCSITRKNIKRKIGGTKGSHIIIDLFDKGPKQALLLTAKSDSRPFFIIPWLNYYIIGTTDIYYDGDLDKVHADMSEIQYLINESNNVLKEKQILRNDILFSYSGIRPLPYSEGNDPAKITRKYIIFDHKVDGIDNLVSVIGGKLSTYRSLAEKIGDLIFEKIGYEFKSSNTKNIPLVGNIDSDFERYRRTQSSKAQNKYDLDADIVSHLINLYGKNYKHVLEIAKKYPDTGKLLSSNALDIRAQVYFALENEHAFTISDVYRRISLGLCKGLGEDALNEVSKIIKEYFRLTDEDINEQINEYYQNIYNLRMVK